MSNLPAVIEEFDPGAAFNGVLRLVILREFDRMATKETETLTSHIHIMLVGVDLAESVMERPDLAEMLGQFITDVVLMPNTRIPRGGGRPQPGLLYYLKLGFRELDVPDTVLNATLMQLPPGWRHKRVPLPGAISTDQYTREIFDANNRLRLTTWYKQSQWESKSMTYEQGDL